MSERVTCNKQGGRPEPQGSLCDQQPVYTSMAGEDGSLVMLGDSLSTHSDEMPPPKTQEPFVLLDGIPQVRIHGCTDKSLAHCSCMDSTCLQCLLMCSRRQGGACNAHGRPVYVIS